MNSKILKLIKNSGIKHWQLARQLNIHESTLSRWFRDKLSDEQETQIILAVETINLSRERSKK